MSPLLDDLRACADAGEKLTESGLQVWRAQAVVLLRMAADDVEYLRSVGGAVSQGASFGYLRAQAKNYAEDATSCASASGLLAASVDVKS